MSNEFITIEDAQNAFDFLWKSIPDLEASIENEAFLDKKVEIVEATIMDLHKDQSVASQQRIARCSPEYEAVIRERAAARAKKAGLIARRDYADKRISAWQTWNKMAKV